MSTITINPLASQPAPNTAFDLTGTWKPTASAAPAMTVKVDAGAATAFPSGSTLPAADQAPAENWIAHNVPGLAAGAHTITISDGTASANITVTPAAGGGAFNAILATNNGASLTLGGVAVTIDNAYAPDGGNIKLGGTNIPGGDHSFAVAVSGGVLYGQDGSSGAGGQWYSDTSGAGGNWAPVATPPGLVFFGGTGGGPLTITGVSVNPASFTANSPVGTVVGTLAATITGGSGSPSFAMGTGDQSADFKIAGTQLELNVATIAAGNLTADVVPTLAGAIGSGTPFKVPVVANPATVGSGVFTVTAAGGFIDLHGRKWNGRGICSSPGELLTGFNSSWKSLLPGLSFVRLVCDSTFSQDRFSQANTDAAIALCTAHNVLVNFEDHSDPFSGSSQGNGFTQQFNTSWYQMMASKYKANPMVFCETPNEAFFDAGTGALVSAQVALINAIRGAGWVNPIGIMANAGFMTDNYAGVLSGIGGTKQMFGVRHIYGDSNPAGAIAEVAGFGLYPCIDEFGGSGDGVNEDANGRQDVAGVIASQQAGNCIAAFWYVVSGTLSDSVFTDASQTALSAYGSSLVAPWLSGSPMIEP